MMFVTMIPLDEEEYKPKKKKSSPIIDERVYFIQDVDKLQPFACPTCGEHKLFRGVVYIGCRGCLNYFDENDIIKANGGD